MNNVTSEPRRCRICGDPVRRNNKYGICSDSKKSACRLARLREMRGLPEPAQKHCSVCGGPIRSDNEMGICQKNPQCSGERFRKLRNDGPMGRDRHRDRRNARHCEVCGSTLRRDNASGLCHGRGRPACQEERDRRRRSDSPPDLSSFTPLPYIAAGTVFERLTVLEDAWGSTERVLCRCACDGTEKRLAAIDLVVGDTRSCGCLRRELMTTHGMYKHPLYPTWNGIIQRTTNPEDDHYPNYGARGIGVCARWLDVRVFIGDIEREIGPRPGGVTGAGAPSYSLDRIDVDGNYESGNVQWATWIQQSSNRRKVPQLTRERDALAVRVQILTAQLDALRREGGEGAVA
jgi:predicted nucleic acid-binding Zn ribbon protein